MSSRPICKYGDKCYRKNADHLKNYDHSSKNENDNEINENDKTNSDDSNSSDLSKENKSEKLSKSLDNLSKNEKNKETELEKLEKFDLSSIKDLKEFVLENNSMQMPDDFYELLEFCKLLDKNDPKNALNIIDIELTGIYDLIINGYKLNYKLHSRYFYDPPEFQTVLNVKNSDNLLHFGYFRDDPDELPNFVGINEAKIDCKIHPKGRNYKCNSSIDDLKSLKTQLNDWCEKHHKNDKTFSLQLKTPKIKSREKKSIVKFLIQPGWLFLWILGFGYREVPETYENQKKIFTNYCLKDESETGAKTKKNKANEKIQEIVTLIQFANDETDYGMGLEFGLNMFCFGDILLHKFIKSILPVCYELLGRNYYSEILLDHLKNRKLKN